MGSVGNKYRVHEVAKDFGVPTKQITEILTKYAETPKNHMQVLEDRELSLIFEYLTQHNQVSGIQVIFAEGAKPAEKKQQPAAKPAEKKPEGKGESRSAKQETKPVSRVPQTKVVDTRKATAVNLDKYDEKLQDMAEGRTGGGRRAQQQTQGKEKFRNGGKRRDNGFSNKRKQEEADRLRRLRLEVIKKTPVTVQIPDEISVGELASRMKKTGAEVVKCLMKNGVMASLSQMIDFDTASFVAEELGCKVEKEVVVTIEEKLIDTTEDRPEDLVPRAPVVVVMGHVDHGKTSLLDTIRNTSVASGEAGGITQHIGAYQAQINGKPITFLDTPGHEAFTSMRARGAMVTDIAILMVAADDGIMPQTVESINHAKAANIPIIVAVNKIDKENANPDRVMQQLTEYGLVPEEWGGETIVCKISAKKHIGIENLLENLALLAEVQELKANPNRAGQGTVIEARLDKGRGPVATLLVQNGTLKQGDIIIAGTSVGRVRTMLDYRGNRLTEAGPSDAVEILGLQSVPNAGDEFRVFEDEREARALADERSLKARIEEQSRVKHVTLENLFETIADAEVKELNLIIKADVQGSIEALQDSLDKMDQSEVRINTIHSAVGAINETDVVLADASNAIIIGFGVRPDGKARSAAEREGVEIRCYDVIYKCLEELDAARIGMLKPTEVEVSTGTATVLDTFKVPKVGIAAGVRVEEGEIAATDSVRLVRDGIVVFNGKIASMRHYKDEAKSLKSGSEGGIGLENFQDIKPGDQIEGYRIDQVARTE